MYNRKEKIMTTSVSAAMPQQAYPAYDFQPSYNAVQLNLKQPTLNVPQSQPMPQPQQADGQKSWVA